MISEISEYVDNGWSILPVKPEEKRPYMTNWLQYTKTRATREMVENWFRSLSGAGVGAVTGRISNMIVLDVESWCKTPIEEILKKYPTQMIARSGSGGYHFYYQYPQTVSKVSNRVGIFEGADLRADGGFIVLPPTIHPNGNRYEWIKKGPLGAFPMALLEAESKPQVQNEGWITEALRGVSEGGRNDTCARLAGYFFKKGVSADIVEALLLDWNEKCDPPMPLRELRTTLKSIERSHSGAETQFTSVQFENDQTPEEQKNSGFDVMKMSDYVKGYGGEGVSWLVEDWLPDKSITFLISPPESYKTWILLDLAVSVAAGVPFLGGYRVNQAGPTLIIQQEDSHTGLTDRLALIVEQKMNADTRLERDQWQVPAIPDIPIYIHPSRMLRFDNKKVIEELEKQIEIIKPKVILIDPLYSTTASTDNYMSDLANQMMVLKTWRDKYGCSFVIAHHSKKNLDPDSTAREDSWGSQFLNAFLEAGWQIRRNPRLPNNEVIVRRHSKVMGNQSPISLTFNISTKYPMKYEVISKAYDAPTPSNAQRQPAQANLLDLLKKGDMTQTDICEQTGKSKSTISRQIKQLEAAGLISHMPDGKWHVREEVEN
jgi:DNA-binding transcriptional ArsR family regulator